MSWVIACSWLIPNASACSRPHSQTTDRRTIEGHRRRDDDNERQEAMKSFRNLSTSLLINVCNSPSNSKTRYLHYLFDRCHRDSPRSWQEEESRYSFEMWLGVAQQFEQRRHPYRPGEWIDGRHQHLVISIVGDDIQSEWVSDSVQKWIGGIRTSANNNGDNEGGGRLPFECLLEKRRSCASESYAWLKLQSMLLNSN